MCCSWHGAWLAAARGADLCIVHCRLVCLHARHSVQYCAVACRPSCFHAQTALKGLHATAPSILLLSQVQGGAAGLPGFEAGLPMFVGGISLGGCIAFNAALADREAGGGLFRWVDGRRGGQGIGGCRVDGGRGEWRCRVCAF